jgi:hypothetical protein
LHGLERGHPIARQFVTFDGDQRSEAMEAKALPAHIETTMNTFLASMI